MGEYLFFLGQTLNEIVEYMSFLLLVYGYYIFPTINMYYFDKYKIMTLNQISKEKKTRK